MSAATTQAIPAWVLDTLFFVPLSFTGLSFDFNRGRWLFLPIM
jgi:hypothetical protein